MSFSFFRFWSLAALVGLWSSPAIAETAIVNQATYRYTDPTSGKTITSQTNQLKQTLIDPLGRITGCAGESLPSYAGFSVGVYETDAAGIELGALVRLTQTEFPDVPNNSIPPGILPNRQNSNPFFLSSDNDGRYNFLLDPNRGQLDVGRTYLLVINPPPNSNYSQRRIRFTITARTDRQVSYRATAIDGKALSTTTGETATNGTLTIQNAEQVGVSLAAIDLSASVCQAQALQIIKTSDRATASPGDTVIYRLSIRNLASSPVRNLSITDLLPLGFRFRENSVKAEFQRAIVPVAATDNGSSVQFDLSNVTLPANDNNRASVLNLVYAAILTPDAIRGSGQNRAIVSGIRADNLQPVKDGPATHRLRIRSGIINDCGTIIGRVFIDKNLDGEQQSDEPGVPNAVVFLDDGNRITTDSNGLFSIANVLSGYRSGVLDLSSIPGYTLAPNRFVRERNSQSRLVHLAPGALVRMNFAVTPISNEAKQR